MAGNSVLHAASRYSDRRNPAREKIFGCFSILPTCSVSRVSRISEVRHAFHFVRLLVHEGVNSDADEQVSEVLIKRGKQQRENYAVKDAERGTVVRGRGEVDVDIRQVATVQMNVAGRKSARMSFSGETID